MGLWGGKGWFVAYLSHRRPSFDPGPILARFVADELTLERGFVLVFLFLLVGVIPPMLHLLFNSTLLRREIGRVLAISRSSNAAGEIWKHWTKNSVDFFNTGSCHLRNSTARFRARVSQCVFCGVESGTGGGFHLSTLDSPCHYRSTIAPNSPSERQEGESWKHSKKLILCRNSATSKKDSFVVFF